MEMNKKGQIFNQMSALGIGIAALAITLVVVFLIISQARTNISDDAAQYCLNADDYINGTSCCVADSAICTGTNLSTTSVAYNSTHTLGAAVDDIPSWVPLIVIAVIGAILLGLVALFRNR